MTAECLCFRSRRLARQITRAYDDALRPLGIEATQLTLMNAIAMGGREGSRMRRIADALAMDMSTLSRNLKPLERDGLIEIVRQPEDRRVKIARLTPSGERRLEEALPLWDKATGRISSALGETAAAEMRLSLDAAAASISQA